MARIWLIFIKGEENKKLMLFSFRNGEIPQLLTYIGIEGDVATLALGS
jgi:hypothetical protein